MTYPVTELNKVKSLVGVTPSGQVHPVLSERVVEQIVKPLSESKQFVEDSYNTVFADISPAERVLMELFPSRKRDLSLVAARVAKLGEYIHDRLKESGVPLSAPVPQIVSNVIIRLLPRTFASEFVRFIPAETTAPILRYVRTYYNYTKGAVTAGDQAISSFGIKGEKLHFDEYTGAPRAMGELHLLSVDATVTPGASAVPVHPVGGDIAVLTLLPTEIVDNASNVYKVQNAYSSRYVLLPGQVEVNLLVTDSSGMEYTGTITFDVDYTGGQVTVTYVTDTLNLPNTISTISAKLYLDYVVRTELPLDSITVKIDAEGFDFEVRKLRSALEVENWLVMNTHGVDSVALLTKVIRDNLALAIDRAIISKLITELRNQDRQQTFFVDLRRPTAAAVLPAQEYATEVYSLIMKTAWSMYAENTRVLPNRMLVDGELISVLESPAVMFQPQELPTAPATLGDVNFAGSLRGRIAVFVDPLFRFRASGLLAYMGEETFDAGAYAAIVHPAVPVPHTFLYPRAEVAELNLSFWEVFGFKLVDSLFYKMVHFAFQGPLGQSVPGFTY